MLKNGNIQNVTQTLPRRMAVIGYFSCSVNTAKFCMLRQTQKPYDIDNICGAMYWDSET